MSRRGYSHRAPSEASSTAFPPLLAKVGLSNPRVPYSMTRKPPPSAADGAVLRTIAIHRVVCKSNFTYSCEGITATVRSIVSSRIQTRLLLDFNLPVLDEYVISR